MYHLRVFLIGLADTPMPVPVMVDERQAVLVLRPLAHSEHIELRISSAHDGLVPYYYTQRPRGLAAPCPGFSISCPLANRIQDSVTLTLCLKVLERNSAHAAILIELCQFLCNALPFVLPRAQTRRKRKCLQLIFPRPICMSRCSPYIQGIS